MTSMTQLSMQQQQQPAPASPVIQGGVVPTIHLVVTPLVKNRVEIDFSAKASKEGLFSMWTSTSDKKISYAKDLTIKCDPTTTTTTTAAGMSSPAMASRSIQMTNGSAEESTFVFENMHHCIFFPLSGTSFKRDVVSTMNNYFVQMIRDNPSSVKFILQCLRETFAFYLGVSRKEEESDSKRFASLVVALEHFIDSSLANLRDASEYQLAHFQKTFTAHLTEAFKKTSQSGSIDSALFNDNTAKFKYILSMAVEAVESNEKSKMVKSILSLDPYQEKICYLRAKALSSKEFFTYQLKHRRLNMDANPFYGKSNFESEKNFQSWRRAEEASLQRLAQLIQPREDYLKSIWGIKYKEKDTLGVIAIKVVQARDLINKEGATKPEPFLEIEFAGDKKQTQIKFGEIGLTITEDKLFRQSIDTLSGACKMWITNFHNFFPQNTPPGSLRMLIDIYYLLRSSELTQHPPLPDLVREIYEKRYLAANNMAQDLIKGTSMSRAASVVRVCDILLFNLEIDKKFFSRDFPSDSNILTTSIQVYTKSLSMVIDELTEKGANNPQELSEFLELYFKLKETMAKFRDINPKLVVVPIPVLFKQCVLQWTLHSAGELKNLVDKVCTNEKWTPVSDDTLHSASVGEVLLGCYHALDVIKSLRWEELQRDHQNGQHTLFEIFSNFTMVISESIIYYTNVIKDTSLTALDQAADQLFLLSDTYSPELVQTVQKVSLRFNNIQACVGHTEDLISVLLRIMESYKLSPAIVNNMSNYSFLAIHNNVRTLIDRIYDRLSPVIVGEIYRIMDIDLDKTKNIVVDFFQKIEKNLDFTANNNVPVNLQLTPLLMYIASKLQLFSQYLYYPLTKQLLKRLWAGIIRTLDEMIFPSNQKAKLDLSLQQLNTMEAMVKCFGEFFLVDGDGLSQKAIDKQSERFIVIICAYREAVRSGVRDFDPLGLKHALKNINFSNLKPDLTYLKKLNINLKGIPKQLDIFSLIKDTTAFVEHYCHQQRICVIFGNVSESHKGMSGATKTTLGKSTPNTDNLASDR
eukprot:gene14365-16952_t